DVVKIKPNCDNITIRNCEIYNSGTAYRGGAGNAEGIDNVNGDGMKAQNNYIHDICSTAIYAKGGAADALIENNRIEGAKEAGILVGFDTSPEYFDLAANPRYYESIRCVVRNNLIIDTGLSGIGLYAAKDAQIYGNTLVNVAKGQNHSAIYFGISFQDWESYAGRPATINPSIHHNIVCQPATVTRPMVEIRYANELGGLSALEGNLVMGENCYYIAGKKAAFADRRPGRLLENGGLAAWQSHIGGDMGSVEADPRLDARYLPANPLCAGMGIAASASVLPAPGQPTTKPPSAQPQNPSQKPPAQATTHSDVEASAYVVKQSGNQNELHITVRTSLAGGYARETTATYLIKNNSMGTYKVGNYRVFVDTKGNDQIRSCYIVD
ncbi:MAG: right-handed parallel beta-helix repeat-containing protein, partial [Clostridiales bacterium]|nr:right-handed parallel beta-helix repeat-containing protein [Clostridiales bacterium]